MSIHINPAHKGLLHKDLGVKQDHKLTEAEIQRGKHSEDPAVRRRATFAENAKHWHHHSGAKTHWSGK